MLRPLIDGDDPAALFLHAHFSLRDTESDEQFDARRLGILQRLTDLGYAPAVYELGICYEVGDLVPPDPLKAAALHKRAAELGNAKAKLSYGLNLFYGSNGTEKNSELGRAFIRQAADEDVEGAEARWKDLNAV